MATIRPNFEKAFCLKCKSKVKVYEKANSFKYNFRCLKCGEIEQIAIK